MWNQWRDERRGNSKFCFCTNPKQKRFLFVRSKHAHSEKSSFSQWDVVRCFRWGNINSCRTPLESCRWLGWERPWNLRNTHTRCLETPTRLYKSFRSNERTRSMRQSSCTSFQLLMKKLTFDKRRRSPFTNFFSLASDLYTFNGKRQKLLPAAQHTERDANVQTLASAEIQRHVDARLSNSTSALKFINSTTSSYYCSIKRPSYQLKETSITSNFVQRRRAITWTARLEQHNLIFTVTLNQHGWYIW